MNSSENPRITFGIIVLNGEPFTRYCLRSLYPFAHEIIVVEGACRAAQGVATEDGHSRDGTRETLYNLQREEDPGHKVRIVTKNGFWTEKDEQSQAYASFATGNYLWQVDIDEFYDPEQMQAIITFLKNNPAISMVSIKQLTFWGGFDYICTGWYLKRGAEIYDRIFRWNPGYRYVSHRPPRVADPEGVDMSQVNRVILDQLLETPVFLYHYSLVFPKQVQEKCEYYQNVSWTDRKGALDWAEQVFLHLKRPFRVHNVYQYPSWLEKFHGKHPPQIEALRADMRLGKIIVKERNTGDIESLIGSPVYRMGRLALIFWNPIDQILSRFLHRLVYAIKHPVRIFASIRRKSVYYLKHLF